MDLSLYVFPGATQSGMGLSLYVFPGATHSGMGLSLYVFPGATQSGMGLTLWSFPVCVGQLVFLLFITYEIRISQQGSGPWYHFTLGLGWLLKIITRFDKVSRHKYRPIHRFGFQRNCSNELWEDWWSVRPGLTEYFIPSSKADMTWPRSMKGNQIDSVWHQAIPWRTHSHALGILSFLKVLGLVLPVSL